MPAKDNVVIRMSAEDAGAFEEWRKQAKGPEAMGDAIEKASAKGKRHSNELAQELEKVVGKWTSIAFVIESAKKAMEHYFETKREMERGEAQAAQTADAALRTYFTTQKISDSGQQALATQRIGNVALSRHASLASAGGAANLLAQFGVSREDAEGGALNELLQLQSATSAAGGDSEGMTRRVLDIIHRAMPGGKVTAQNIRSVGVATRQLTGQEGFDEKAIDLFARTATDLTKGGYDYGTGLALATAVAGQYDAREGRKILRGYAKPGMQKGEAEDLARARGLLGGGGTADAYAQAVGIGESGPGAVVRESETGGVLGELGGQQLNLEQVRLRAKALSAAYGLSEERRAFVNNQLNPMFPSWWSESELIGEAQTNIGHGLAHPVGSSSRGADAEQFRRIGRQLRGDEPIPLTIRIKGQDGRDVPHSVEAAGIQGR